jgi:hypothetical protein
MKTGVSLVKMRAARRLDRLPDHSLGRQRRGLIIAGEMIIPALAGLLIKGPLLIRWTDAASVSGSSLEH